MTSQPTLDCGTFVGACVVEDYVDVQGSGHTGVNAFQEPAELAGTLPGEGLANDVARLCVERRVQGCGAVTL